MVSLKHVITSLILVSFLAIALWSFGTMIHHGSSTFGECPFSAVGVSICPQNTLAVVIHHISAYNSFLNVSAGMGTTLSLLVLILSFSLVFIFSVSPPLLLTPVVVNHINESSSATLYKKQLRHWLSLFEHSPSSL